jgi:hypothetical protein
LIGKRQGKTKTDSDRSWSDMPGSDIPGLEPAPRNELGFDGGLDSAISHP